MKSRWWSFSNSWLIPPACQRFILNDRGSEGGSFKAETAKMLAKVMHNNRRLNYIEAFFKPTYYKVYLRALEAGKAVMAASNRAENNEDVDEEEERREEDDPIIELPLPMSTKCAFLSTFPHHSGDSNTTISRDLDMQATLLIFEFAATPVRRTAVIRQESYDF